VILCAQAARVDTHSAQFFDPRVPPKALANSSGLLGHYLMDHVVGGWRERRFDDLRFSPAPILLTVPNGIYLVRFRNTPATGKHPHFIRGYGFQGGLVA